MGSDYKLVKELKLHSAKAFKIVYEQYKNLVFYQAYLILNNKEDAEDVTQNSFIKLMNSIDAIRDDTNLKQLLSKISRNEAIDLYRKKVNQKEIYDENLLNSLSDENSNELNVVMTLNNLLSKDEANIMILKIVFDYSFIEIAEEINDTIGVIQAKYYKALKKLKRYYKESELK